jgi:hypothetical protein
LLSLQRRISFSLRGHFTCCLFGCRTLRFRRSLGGQCSLPSKLTFMLLARSFALRRAFCARLGDGVALSPVLDGCGIFGVVRTEN